MTEKRVRGKHGRLPCGTRFLESAPAAVDPRELDVLTGLDRQLRTNARRLGRSTPVVPSWQHANKRPLPDAVPLPTRRLRAKTSPPDVQSDGWRVV